jgi:hypothetical protein
MPGISLVYDVNKLDSDKVADSLAALKHEPNYETSNIYETPNFSASFTGYEGYPRQSFESEDAVYFIEGIIYNQDDANIADLLKNIAGAYQKGNDYRKLTGKFVDGADGDFNILIYLKKLDELLIFNDRWGKLPIYYFHDNDLLALSRELKFVLDFVPSVEFVKTSLADYLIFRHMLGDSTLFKNIFRLGPSGILYLKRSNHALVVNKEHSLDVNLTQSAVALSERECVKRCKDLFLQGIENRVKKLQARGYRITADLSGGYDTRGVLAGLEKIKAKVDFYNDPIRNYESKYVDALAVQYGFKPIRIEADRDIKLSMSAITFLTDCNVDAQTALDRYQSSLSRARSIQEKSAKFMGLGGEVLRLVYKNVRGYKSMADMVKDSLFDSCGYSINQACSILNLDEASYYEYLTQYFNTYPESTLRDKSKRLYFEFTTHIDIVGEDRHRLHFWTVTPFWNKDLQAFAFTGMPIKYIGFGFNRKVIRAINPGILKVPLYINFIDLDSKLSVYRKALTISLRMTVKNILRGNKSLYRLGVRIDKYIKNKQDKVLATKNDIYEKGQQEIMTSYSSLKILSSLFNKNAMLTLADANETRLFQLLTCVLYCTEIERRYGAKIHSKSS